MKKSIIALLAAATVTVGVNAQEAQEDNAGGSNATESTKGGVDYNTAVIGGAIAALTTAIMSNNKSDNPGKVAPVPGPDPDPDPDPEPTCEGSDPLVDGVCVGTTNTVTVTGTGTMTSTITVPVTFTYAPTVQ